MSTPKTQDTLARTQASKRGAPSYMAKVLLLFSFLLIAVSFVWIEQANAQVTGPDQQTQGATPGGVDASGSSDADLWRAIRNGQQGTVVGQNKGSGLMIQSAGQDWREIRNGPLPMYSAWALLGTIGLLSVFFAVRGRVRISHGATEERITRFSLLERASHWLLASSFIILALTGLNLIFGKDLLMPLIGKSAFATITIYGKFFHNYVAFAFIVALVLVTIMWVRHNIPALRDLQWFAQGGGLIGLGHPPAKKFNAGQKIIFWVVVLCGASISLSGWALMNPFTTNMMSETFAILNGVIGTNLPTDLTPIEEQQYQSIWHASMAVFMIVVIIAHIYIGSVGMEGAIDAMTSGEVDLNWAKEHHSIWVEEEMAREKAPDAITDAGDAGPRVQPAE